MEYLFCAEHLHEAFPFILLGHGGEVVFAEELLNQQVGLILRFGYAFFFPDYFFLGFTGGVARSAALLPSRLRHLEAPA